jgi:predicted TIM-barrel fold metal-dependent hydrolase
MRIDIHAYIGHWPFRPLHGNTSDGLLASMKRYGIDYAVVSNIHGIFYKNPQAANEELAAAVAHHGGRLIPFAVLNPTYTDWEYDLEMCHTKLGMRGIRLYPQYHDYDVRDPRLTALMKMASGLKMPVAFSLRVVDDRQRSWLDVDKRLNVADIAWIVERAPESKLVVLNAALPATNDSASQILEKADILFDTVYASGTGVAMGAYHLADGIAKYGPKKFAFGTAAPFREPVTALLRIEVSKETDAVTKDLIWSGNTRRFLGGHP